MFEIGGSVIERIAVFLTGPRSEDGAFTVRRLSVFDKHGRHHTACNAKVNVSLRRGPPLFLGLQNFEVNDVVRAVPSVEQSVKRAG